MRNSKSKFVINHQIMGLCAIACPALFLVSPALADQQPGLTQPGPPATPINNAPRSPLTATPQSTAADLDHDPALQVKISFQAKRLPLSDVIAELQKQTGITLTAAPDSPAATVRVLAVVKDMPLGAAMGAFTRLYGVTWTKQADNFYLMGKSQLTEPDQKLLSFANMGHREVYRWGQDPDRAWEAGVRELMENADREALRSKAGMAVADLPADLQTRLRQYVAERNAYFLLRSYRKATNTKLEDAVLQVSGPQTIQLPQGPTKLRPFATLYSSDKTSILAQLPFGLRPVPLGEKRWRQTVAKIEQGEQAAPPKN